MLVERGRSHEGCTAAEVVVAQRVGEEVARLGRELGEIVIVVLVAADPLEVLIGRDCVPIGQLRLQCLGSEVAIRLTCTPKPLRADGTDSGQIGLTPAVSPVNSEVHSRRQARENVIVDREVAEGADCLALVLNLLRQGDRVAVRLLARSGLVKRCDVGCRIDYINRECRIEGNHVDENAAFEASRVVGKGIGVLSLRSREVEPEPQRPIQRVVDAVESSRISLEAAIEHHAFLVQIVYRGAILCFGSATGEGEVVLESGSATGDRLLPVGAGGSQGRGYRNCSFRNLVGNEGPVLIPAEYFQMVSQARAADLELVLDCRSARRPLFRLDQDDAICGAAAVDRRCRSILEDGDRGDIGRIDEIQRAAWQRRRVA